METEDRADKAAINQVRRSLGKALGGFLKSILELSAEEEKKVLELPVYVPHRKVLQAPDGTFYFMAGVHPLGGDHPLSPGETSRTDTEED